MDSATVREPPALLLSWDSITITNKRGRDEPEPFVWLLLSKSQLTKTCLGLRHRAWMFPRNPDRSFVYPYEIFGKYGLTIVSHPLGVFRQLVAPAFS